MEQVCSQCHAVLAPETVSEWCPSCGGALVEREWLDEGKAVSAVKVEVDHRGIILPRRHAVGGIITPQ